MLTLEKNRNPDVSAIDLDRELKKHILPRLAKVKFHSIKDDRGIISPEDYKCIAEKLNFEFYNPGEIIFNAGDPGDLFYIIFKGKVSV